MLNRIMARLAWATVGFIALAQISQVPSIERSLRGFESSANGRALIVVVLVVWGGTALALWGVSLAYALQRARERSAPYYPVALLVVSNFIGALIYYFLFVRRHLTRNSRPDAR